MALQTINKHLVWPGISVGSTGSPALATVTTIDASGEYAGMVFRAPSAMTISHVGFQPHAASGVNPDPKAEIRIETIDANGLPSGTLFGTNTNAVTGTLAANTWILTALTASASIAAGDYFAVIFKYSTATSFANQQISNLYIPNGYGLPYYVANTGTPTKFNLASTQNIALGSSATTFYNMEGIAPATSITNISITSSGGTGFDAAALRFQVPFKCRIIGMVVSDVSVAATDDFSVGIYNDAGTEVGSSSTAFTADYQAIGTGKKICYFDNSVTPTINTWYRAAVIATTTNALGIPYAVLPDVTSAAYNGAWPAGSVCHMAARASSGGAWTDYNATTNYRMPMIDLIIDQLDDGASTGGGTKFSAFVG